MEAVAALAHGSTVPVGIRGAGNLKLPNCLVDLQGLTLGPVGATPVVSDGEVLALLSTAARDRPKASWDKDIPKLLCDVLVSSTTS